MTITREFWIGTSWKMNKNLSEAQLFANELSSAKDTNPRIQRFVIPSFTNIREVKSILNTTNIKVGAQNMHWLDEGAWTGEISPLMLKDCGMDMVELGHSERREHFKESNETVGLKVEAALRHGLIPLICIGETLAERENGQAQNVLEKQVQSALGALSQNQKSQEILFAYEPVWAIGAGGTPASSEYADAQHAFIAKTARVILDRKPPVLYGGSVNIENCKELIACPNIDGLFIGRSAWNVEGYLNILAQVSTVI